MIKKLLCTTTIFLSCISGTYANTTTFTGMHYGKSITGKTDILKSTGPNGNVRLYNLCPGQTDLVQAVYGNGEPSQDAYICNPATGTCTNYIYINYPDDSPYVNFTITNETTGDVLYKSMTPYSAPYYIPCDFSNKKIK